MGDKWDVPALLGGVVIAVLFGCLAITIGGGWATLASTEGQTWAAWVQAVGSILGLAIAIALPWWQRAREAEEQRKSDIARAHVVATSVHLMVSAAEACANAILTKLSECHTGHVTFDPKVIIEMLGNLQLPDQAQMLDLMPIDRELPVALARGTLKLRQALGGANMVVSRTDPHKVTAILIGLTPTIESAAASFRKASGMLSTFLRPGDINTSTETSMSATAKQ